MIVNDLEGQPDPGHIHDSQWLLSVPKHLPMLDGHVPGTVLCVVSFHTGSQFRYASTLYYTETCHLCKLVGSRCWEQEAFLCLLHTPLTWLDLSPVSVEERGKGKKQLRVLKISHPGMTPTRPTTLWWRTSNLEVLNSKHWSGWIINVSFKWQKTWKQGGMQSWEEVKWLWSKYITWTSQRINKNIYHLE